MEDFDRDYWMDAKESMKYGIVDGILKNYKASFHQIFICHSYKRFIFGCLHE